MKTLGMAFLAMVGMALPSFATAITVDGSYHEFGFSSVGPVVTCGGSCTGTTSPVAEQTSSPPWTFSGPATIFVVDLFLSTDRFEVFDNAISLGLTSVAVAGGACGGDIACSIADARYSRGSFGVGAGAHSLTINFLSGQSGAAVFSASNSVPEPGSLLSMGAGLAMLGVWSRRKYFAKR
ncbi:MAG: PEP-CTERM sorting domain-containing protein [Acidobacteriota bacterium]